MRRGYRDAQSARNLVETAAREHPEVARATLHRRIAQHLPPHVEAWDVQDDDFPRLEYLMRKLFSARLGPQRTDIEHASTSFANLVEESWARLQREGRAAVDALMRAKPVRA